MTRAIRRLRMPLLGTLVLAAAIPLGVASATQDDDHPGPRNVLRSNVAASLPTDPAVFSVLPGTAPWAIDEGSVRLRADGGLRVRVRALVIPTPPANGTNPVPTLSASVFCAGTLVATTATVPFSPTGDARVATDIGDLPSPCVSPAVLIHPNATTTRYIAFNGSR